MKLIAFARWIFQNAFAGISNVNQGYREFMQDQPWGGIIIGLLLSVVTFLLFALTTIAVCDYNDTKPARWMLVCCILPQITYIVYTGFSLMYEAFCRERAELFETIKNGK
jgi:hypothetical protein